MLTSSSAPTVTVAASTPTIAVLPPHVVNRIAAGEVVERPASVVKELVENALDAGATKIHISASNGGRTLRIADNGHGMSEENALKAFLNHATSKIQTDDDLSRIATFGFRGEALASIAAVSQLTCHTRTAQAETGTKITFTELGEPRTTPAGCAVGTIMEIAELFSTVPARLKFLKQPATELSHVEDTVQRLALAHPSVQFSLTINDREAVTTDGQGQLSATFSQTYRVKDVNRDFLAVTLSDDDYAVSGLTSTPMVMKNNRKHLLTYVNGRAVQCSVMSKAIEAAYESLLPHGKYPFAVVFLTLPASAVDVNVHPTKKEVRYAEPNRIFGLVKSAVRRTLEAANIRPLIQAPALAYPTSGEFTGQNTHPGYPSSPSYPTAPVGFPASGFHRMEATHHHHQQLSTLAIPIQANEKTAPLTAETMQQQVKVIGQLFNTYILLETPQGLMVVDQHIASERTVFEQLKRQQATQQIESQPLLASTPLSISPLQHSLLGLHQSHFAQLGFTYQLPTESTVQLTAVPLVYLEKHRPEDWFMQALAELEDDSEIQHVDIELLLATMACHRAVRAGDTLTHEEMTLVIQQWLACTLPWTCPHGRPIAHTIQADDLNRFFHRPSLPVNSGVTPA